MASYTATKSGNWSDTTVWGGGPPGNGDTATIGNFTITVDSNVTVGTSGISGTAAITMSGTSSGTLIIPFGVTLTFRGDIVMSGAGALLQMNAGSTLTHDSSQAASPSTTQYVINFSGTSAQMQINGSSGSHCTINSVTASSALFGSMTLTAHVFNGCTTATYADFLHFGDSTHDCLTIWANGGQTVLCDHCTFNGCGQVHLQLGSMTGAGSFTYTNNTHINSASGAANFAFPNVALTTGTRLIQSNYFDAADASWTIVRDQMILGNVFPAASPAPGGAAAPWAVCQDNLYFRDPGSGSSMFNCAGSITNCYIINKNNANTHGIQNISSSAITVSGCIFEFPNATQLGGGGFIGAVTASTVGAITNTMKNCIWLPTKGANDPAIVGWVYNGGSATSITLHLEHNTIYTGNGPGFSNAEQSEPLAGAIERIGANIFFSFSTNQQNNSLKGWVGHDTTTGGTQDICSPANMDYNASWGSVIHTDFPSVYPGNTYANAGNGYQMNLSAEAGAHDLNNLNPQFVDVTRNAETFSTNYLGNAAAGSNNGDIQNTLTWISQSPQTVGTDTVQTRIQTLVKWVKAGFAPANAQYNFTFPGDTNAVTNLGAVQMASGVPGFIGANRMMGTNVKASKDFVGGTLSGT